VKDEPERIRLVKQLISQLPAANKRLLADLLLFLQNLTQYANVTKMGSQNLAIVFGPNLIRPREDSIETLLHNMNHVNTVVCTMIEHVHAVCTIKSRPLVASEHDNTLWYYISNDQWQIGPISSKELMSLHDQYKVLPETYVWHAGLKDWIEFSTIQ